jgi:hypothetical protein
MSAVKILDVEKILLPLNGLIAAIGYIKNFITLN